MKTDPNSPSFGQWLTIVGLGEDGPNGLSAASQKAIQSAQIIMGPPRHLALLGQVNARVIAWPVPFSSGVEQLLALRGQNVVVLASGDPFWFGAGSVLAGRLSQDEWVSHPAPSSFSLAANALGWAMDKSICMGLHAAPFARLRSALSPNRQILATLRDGDAVRELAQYLSAEGFGASQLYVLERLGGKNERITELMPSQITDQTFEAPVMVGIMAAGDGPAIPLSSGIDDDFFMNDGQITKRPIRALTLSALRPKPYERLWDIGGGSGSIAIEWLLRDPTLSAVSFEQNPARADRIAANAAGFGVDRLDIRTGKAPDILADAPLPDAVFIGGGLSDHLLKWIWLNLPAGTRLVANGVTLESESLLAIAHKEHGGDLMRVEIATAAPIGPRRGWRASYPIVQWSVTL